MLKKALLRAIQPVGVKNIRKEFGDRPFRLLDIGAGNHSATFLTDRLPHCEYYGIDITRNFNNDEKDFSRMKGFWEMDLTKLKFEGIPDDFFDVLYAAHVMEHLHNGDLVLATLLSKLRAGGVLYIEYPRLFSTRLPSMRETLNFFDDETHCRIYSIPEIYNILMKNNCRPIKGGVRRNWYTILLMPVQVPRMYFKRGYLVGADFWDLLGFAEYVFARKIK
jgi:trans-aconitate methyltransferase